MFGSEIKPLLLAVGRPSLDVQGLQEWLLYQSVEAPAPGTLLGEVRALLPGEILRVAGGRIESRRWYLPPERVRADEMRRLGALPPEAVVNEVEGAVQRAVSERLMSDVPVGTLLSGGLNSSLVTALAARERPITCFPRLGRRPRGPRRAPLRARRGRAPEARAGRPTGSTRRLPPRPGARRALSDLPLTHANSVAYLQICETARAHGTLSCSRGRAPTSCSGLSLALPPPRDVLRALRWLEPAAAKAAARRRAPRPGQRRPAGRSAALRRAPAARPVADRGARRDWRARCAEAYAFVDDPIDRSTLGTMLADLGDFLTPLLRRLDHMSMGASVECRVPFLDHRVVELASISRSSTASAGARTNGC